MRSEGFRSEGFRSEGMPTEGLRSEGFGTEGVRSEGIPGGSVRPDVVRREPLSALHADGTSAPQDAGEVRPPAVALLQTREGLAQAVLLAEVLGKPRALRPYRRN